MRFLITDRCIEVLDVGNVFLFTRRSQGIEKTKWVIHSIAMTIRPYLVTTKATNLFKSPSFLSVVLLKEWQIDSSCGGETMYGLDYGK